MAEARARRGRPPLPRTPTDDVEMRDAEGTAPLEGLAADVTGKGALEEDKSSSDGSSEGLGDQSDADVARMSDGLSDENKSGLKAAQTLSIRTPDAVAHSEMASTDGLIPLATSVPQLAPATPSIATGKPEAKAKTPTAVGASTVPSSAPGSGKGKKRQRRTAAQIDRKYSCTYPGCTKAYGSEGSLTHHQRLKHRHAQEEALATSQKAQHLRQMFLPLHHSASEHLKAASFLPPSSASTARTVSIRPAAIGGLPGSPFNAASSGSADTSVRLRTAEAASAIPGNVVTVSQKAEHAKQRSNSLRSRSNSMPISFTTPPPVQTKRAPASSSRTSTRKLRTASTPRPKSTTARRAKSRSKSESLSSLASLTPLDGMQPPRSDRSISDSTASTHEPVLPLESAGAHPLRSSWSMSDVTMSMEDQAIDSDILSVLANCDPGDLVDGPVSLVAHNEVAPTSPPAFHSQTFTSMEDQDMLPVGLDCFKITEDRPVIDTVGNVKRESYRSGLSLQHDGGNVAQVGGDIGDARALYSAPAGLSVDVNEMAMASADEALTSPSVTAFNPSTDNFGMTAFDAPVENNSHSLSQINIFNDSVKIGHVDRLSSIPAFEMDTVGSTKMQDPGTPLQGIPTKLGKLNIENNWRDVTSLLNEPDSEEHLHQESQQVQQPQEHFNWTKDSSLGSAVPAGSVARAQKPALTMTSAEMDWRSSSKFAPPSSDLYLQTSGLHTDSAIGGLLGDYLMSDGGEFPMMDLRIQTQVFGQEDEFL